MFLKNKILHILIIILSFLCLPSYATQWGAYCKISPLPSTQFCTFCISEGDEWEEWNIDPQFDDILKQNGWKPKQVALVMRLFLRYHIQKTNSIPINTEYQKEILYLLYELLTDIDPIYNRIHFNKVESNTAFIQEKYPELRFLISLTALTSEDLYKVCANNTHQCFSDQVRDPHKDRCVIDCNGNGQFDSEDSSDTCDS